MRKLAAILSADIAGFSRLVRQDEDGTLARLMRLMSEAVAPALEAHGGRVIKTLGDGFLAEFASSLDAVSAALAIQAAVDSAERAEPADRRLAFRIGINVGDVVPVDDDLFGDGVNVAARVQALAEPGGICVSQVVHDTVRHRSGFAFADLGDRALKNIDVPVRIFAVRIATDEPAPARAPALPGPFLAEAAATPEGRPSIAILPFRNLAGTAAHDHLADGLRLGVQAALVRLPGLFLVNASVLNRYKSAPADAERAASDLDVRYVLDGAVQAGGGRVRVRLQLLDAKEHRAVWAERYDRPADDVFALEDEIVGEVVDALGMNLVMSEGTRAVAAAITSREERDHFYRAMSNLYVGTRDSNIAARRSFLHLFEKGGETYGAPGNIAVTHWLDYVNDWTDDPLAARAEAERWAEIASGYERNNGLGPTVLANVRLLARRHDEALELGRVGVRSRASCPMSHGGLANIMTFCGDAARAIPHARHALALEKAFPSWMVTLLATAYRDDGDLARAREAAEAALRLNDLDVDARVILCSVHALSGDDRAAQELARHVAALDPRFSLAAYAERQPYRDDTRLGEVMEALGRAGLPA